MPKRSGLPKPMKLSHGDNDRYSQPQQKCYYDETKYTEHCENFEKHTCTHRESCSDVRDQNCRGVVSVKQVRKCFDVTEQRCSLKETNQMPVTVQKCRKVPEQVCDTICNSALSHKERHMCIKVSSCDETATATETASTADRDR